MSVHVPFELTSKIVAGGGETPFFLVGPCVIESDDHARKVAEKIAELADRRGLQLIFKASFDKANRSSVTSFRGPGIEAGLETLSRIKDDTGLPVVTDVHSPEQASVAAEVVDVLQVPAFLCRQTDLLVACGRTGLPVNVKKGQFLAPEDMSNVVNKVSSTGNERILLTERGTTFGYRNLVVDMRGLPVMRRLAPVVFDATHSLQLPGGLGTSTDGAREFYPYLAKAAAGAGVDGFFFEVHTDPENALSDATTQLPVEDFDDFVPRLLDVWHAAQCGSA